MKKRIICSIAATAVTIAGMLVSAQVAVADPVSGIQLTAPSVIAVTVSALVNENQDQPTLNTAVAAATSGVAPVAVTLTTGSTSFADLVRIAPVSAGSHLQFWAKDTDNNWYDINVTGWGPVSGFPLPANYSVTTNVYVLSDQIGTYPVTFNLVDVLNNNGLVTGSTGTINVNPTTPTINLTAPNGGEKWRGTQKVLWTSTGISSDTVSIGYSTNFINYTYSIATHVPADNGSFIWDTTSVTNGLPDGTYKLEIVDDQKAGVLSNNSFIIDNTPPATTAATSTIPTGLNGWYKIPPQITLTCIDNSSGCKQKFYKWDGDSSYQIYNGPITAAEGDRTLYYYSTDNAADSSGQNNQESPKTFEVKTDTIKPTIASYMLNGLAASAIFNPSKSSVTISLTASEPVYWTSMQIFQTDNLGTYKNYSISPAFDQTDSATQVWNGTLTSQSGYDDGVYQIKVHIKDLAGNDANDLVLTPYTITVDTQSPTVANFTSPAAGQIFRPTDKLVFTPDGTGSSVTCSYKIDGGGAVPVSCTSGSPTSASLTGLSEGWHDLVVTVTDAAGNSASSAPVHFLYNGTGTFTVCSTGAEFTDIQSAIDASISGEKINVCAGTFAGFSVSGKTNLTITGAGAASTIIAPTTLIDTQTTHKYTADMQASVFVKGSTGITLQGMTIRDNGKTPGSGGPDAILFWDASTGTVKNSDIAGTYSINGVQTGQGIAVDASGSETTNLAVDSVNIRGFQKNGLDILDGNGVEGDSTDKITVTVTGGSITGAGSTSAIAQNGIVAWNRGGGTVSATVNGTTISNIEYATSPEATGILAYGTAKIATVSNVSFSNVDLYLDAEPGASVMDATSGNTFDGISPTSATVVQLGVIADKIGGAMGNASNQPIFILPNTAIATKNNRGMQAAVDLVTSDGTVIVAPGTYTEQVVINKNLTVIGADQLTTKIQAPVTLVADTDGKYNIVEVTNGATVSISNLTVAGPSSGTCGSIDSGIAVLGGATLHVNASTVKDIRDNPLSGCQNGEGIRVGTPRYASVGQVGHAIIDGVTVTGYQKNGIVIAGAGSTGTIQNSTVTGVGVTTAIAQNGIQVYGGATATISNNTISGNECNNSNCGSSANYYTKDQAAGIILYDAGAVTVSGNTISSSDEGMYVQMLNGLATLTNNTLTSNRYEGIVFANGDVLVSGGSITGSEIGILNSSSRPAPTISTQVHLVAISGNTAGVQNDADYSVDAARNWWGSIEGPTNATLNPHGLGNSVSANIAFVPWCTDSTCSSIDSSAPLATLSGNPSSLTNQPTTDITVGAAAYYEYQLDGGAYNAETPVATHIALSGLTDGSHTLNVIGRSQSGVWQAILSPTTLTWTVDTKAPTLTEVAPVPTPTKNNTPSYKFTSDEAGTITYGGGCSSATGAAINGNNIITFSTLADGSYNCTIKVTDAAGNVSNTLAITSFTVDTTSPIVSAGGNQLTNHIISLTGAVTENGSGVKTVAWTQVSGSGTVTFGTPNALVTSVSANKDGMYQLKLTVTDNAGNVGSGTTNLTWDTTAPVMLTSSPVNGSVNVAVADGVATVTFSEPVAVLDASKISIVQDSSNASVAAGTPGIDSGNAAMLDVPYAGLTNSTLYRVNIMPGAVEDLAGNQLVGNLIVYFTTTATSGTDSTAYGVTQITTTQGYATPGAGFANGWHWTFDVTVPSNETQLQMKLSDFVSGSNVVPAAGNIKIFSPQASDAKDETSGIIISAANTLSLPAMNLSGDLNSTASGRQIQIMVEVQVPADAAGGSYSASYGIHTQAPQ